MGPRDENQDRFFVAPTYAGVADGMGGYAGGATAAELTVAAAQQRLQGVDPSARGAEVLDSVFDGANEAVRLARDADPERALMGATLTVAALLDASADRSRWLVANVGDSPAVLVTGEATTRISIDDTVPGHLLREGAITEQEAVTHPYRHMVLHAIGVEDEVAVSPVVVELGPGQAIVMMSDGVGDVVDLDDIGRLVRTAGDASSAAEQIVDAALARSTTDNATVVVLRHVASFSGGRDRT